jgi:hypothetical protein
VLDFSHNLFFVLKLIGELRKNVILSDEVFYAINTLLSFVSLGTLTAITADRFLAVHLHLRYQELITTKRYGMTLACIWIWNAFLCICTSLLRHVAVVIIVIIMIITSLVMNAYFIFKVSQVIYRHLVQIQAQQPSTQQSIDMPRYKKSVYTMYCVIGTFVLCYTPFLVWMILVPLQGEWTIESHQLFIVSITLVLFNGVLNPLIYCMRIQEIREAVFVLLMRIVHP